MTTFLNILKIALVIVVSLCNPLAGLVMTNNMSEDDSDYEMDI